VSQRVRIVDRVLLGTTCAACGGRSASGIAVCARCAAALSLPPSLPVPLGLDACTSLLGYDDVARTLLTSLKNGNRRDLVGWVADGLAARVGRPSQAVVTWAPTSAARRRRRGFDQAELLARALSRRWDVPCRSLLGRRPGPPQAGRSGFERRRNPGFTAPRPVPRAIVLVDDIATTGATLTAAARSLRGAGAADVRGVVAARASRPPGH
jgi:ComF family protein